ncbi:cyclic nucleotide-binding domain-containing protein [Sulfitobacter sp. BDSS02]|nr:cyclic nucleotide-binding domain-containing protein [Sulfitobacter sp. BDSS02]MBR9847857.1 Crp/Fnr family transcriptional regulator [Paracoccaceae bacterium]
MPIKCQRCPLRNKDAYIDLTPEEIKFMERFKVGELTVDAGAPILMEGSNSPQLFTVLRGLGLRYKTTEDGKRQVINFIFPGDFIGLQAGIMREMGHSVEATTKMTLCVFDRSGIWTLFKSQPERAFDLTWLAAVEEHFLGETLLSLGQRSASQAIAWALLKIFLRGKTLGLVENRAMDLPYRQQDLADALGLSLVHTNKTLAKLRASQLANWSSDSLKVYDIEKLAEMARSDASLPKPRPLL